MPSTYESLLYGKLDIMKASIIFQPDLDSFPVHSQINLSSVLNQDKLYIKIQLQMDRWKKVYPNLFSNQENCLWTIIRYEHIPDQWIDEGRYVSPLYWNLLALAENYGVGIYQDLLSHIDIEKIQLESVPDFWQLVKVIVPSLDY